MDALTATAIEFATPDADAPGGPWPLRVYVAGTGFGAYSQPLRATVGSVPVEGIFLYPDGSGFAGYLASIPNDGDALAVGYGSQLTVTDLVFHPGAVA